MYTRNGQKKEYREKNNKFGKKQKRSKKESGNKQKSAKEKKGKCLICYI